MSSTSRSRQVFHLVLGCLLASGLGGCLGCGGEPVTLESTLRQRFPERAALVLEHGDAFVATEEGFALEGSSARGAWQGVEVTLPREGREAIGFRGFGGVEVRVREIGAEGEGTPAEHAIAYQRAGGTSFWTAMSGGVVEEWLHLDASAVRAGEAVAVWEVEGATVRQRGEGVEVVDASGVVRLSVTAPVAYAVGGREIGTRLVGSGATIELRVDAGGEAVLVDPVWTTASPMSVPRRDHTATRLAGGKVLVAGGYDSSGWTATAEIYDPVMNAWSPASPMSQIRGRHTATLLASGNVLVAGGFAGALYWYDNSEVPLASAELYDPTTDSWSLAGGLNQAREQHTMTLLPSGQVLLVGGHAVQNVRIAVAELYDPASNAWGLAGSLSTARVNHAAALLGSGKVLVAGGTAVLGGTTGYTATAELYDPSMNTWSPAASMIQARQSPIAARLGSDKVLVAGGSNGTALAAAELYDPVMNKWSLTAPMTQPRSDHAAILLGSGKMLTVGGQATGTYLPSAEAYDPGTGLWSAAGALTQGRMLPTMTVLGNGSILVAGGQNSAGSLASAQLYVTSSPLGNPCSLPSDCQSGFCADGVCCDTACNAGPCDACSKAAGASANGTCALLTGPSCDDGDSCTTTDTCQAGQCVGAPIDCTTSSSSSASSSSSGTGGAGGAGGTSSSTTTGNGGVDVTSSVSGAGGGTPDNPASGNFYTCSSTPGLPDGSPSALFSLGALALLTARRRSAGARARA